MKFDTNKMTAPVNALLAAALSVFIYYISARSVGVVRLLLYFPLTTLYIVEGIYWAGAATMLCVTASDAIRHRSRHFNGAAFSCYVLRHRHTHQTKKSPVSRDRLSGASLCRIECGIAFCDAMADRTGCLGVAA